MIKKLLAVVIVLLVCVVGVGSAVVARAEVVPQKTETVYVTVSNEYKSQLDSLEENKVLGVNTITMVDGYEPGLLD